MCCIKSQLIVYEVTSSMRRNVTLVEDRYAKALLYLPSDCLKLYINSVVKHRLRILG